MQDLPGGVHHETADTGVGTGMHTVVNEIELPIGVVDAWSLLTDKRHLWWSDLSFDCTVGAPLTERWLDDDGTELVAIGKIVQVQRPHRLSFVWAAAGEAETLVDWAITATGSNGSQISVRESGLDTVRIAERDEGWKYHLNRLCAAASQGLSEGQ